MAGYWSEGNWFEAAELKRQLEFVRNQAVQVGNERSANLRYLLSSIDQLERDLGRTLLKVQAVVDVLVANGIINTNELAERADELDMLDGDKDGSLNPAIFRTEEERARVAPPRIHLAQLEQMDVEPMTPEEFLANLEQQPPLEDE